MNPNIDDINLIRTNQKIKLPVYSPEVIKMPVVHKFSGPDKTSEESEEKPEIDKRQWADLSLDLKNILGQMGEDWLQKGRHFIPLKSGGEVNLEAEAYPIISIHNGTRIILDLYSDLPEKMANMITGSWGNYKIIRVQETESLPSILAKIFPLCGYERVLGAGDTLTKEGGIGLQLNGDWVIQTRREEGAESPSIYVLTLLSEGEPTTPRWAIDFLRRQGIGMIDYPAPIEPIPPIENEVEVIRLEDGGPDLVDRLLKIIGKKSTRDTKISLYQSQKTGFNLVLGADFLLSVDGKDAIIDFSGLGDETLSLLEEHNFTVLTLAGKDSATVLARTLAFLRTPNTPGPHTFSVTERIDTRNIRLVIPGTIFNSHQGEQIFATEIKLPVTILRFLDQKGFMILALP